MQPMRSIMKDTFNVSTKKAININIDPTKPVEFNLRKFVRYVQKNQEGFSSDDLSKAIKGAGFFGKVEPSSLPDDMLEYLSSIEAITESKILKYTDRVQRDEEQEMYIVLNPKNAFKTGDLHKVVYYSKYPSFKMRRYNLGKFIACGKIMTLLSDDEYRQVYLERAGKELDEHKLLTLKANVFYGLLSGTLEVYKIGFAVFMNELLYTKLQDMYAQELNVRSMALYAKETGNDYAKAFQTKKNIPLKIQGAMAKSGFKQYGFKFVEYDADTDLSKVERIEQDWAELYAKLPKSKQPLDLRFRKLGNYRANGAYFPSFRCMAVDLRAIDSFIHEYAHHLDFTYQDEPLSLTPEFLPIIRKYSQNYDALKGVEESRALTQYYKTPTEIFARAYEIYLVGHKKYKSLLLKTPNRYQSEHPYKAITQDAELLALVNDYFDTVFSK